MDMVLQHTAFRQDGVIGVLQSDDIISFQCDTLEHSYPNEMNGWVAKLTPGIYKCVRGTHNLDHLKNVETFEITGVHGHQGILFHVGNFNNDSDGCVLLGKKIIDSKITMIGESKITFEAFMALQKNVKEFNLTVMEYPSMVGSA